MARRGLRSLPGIFASATFPIMTTESGLWFTFPRLATPRLVLWELAMSDAPALLRLFSDEATMRYWSGRPYTSIEQARALVRRAAISRESETGLHWGISLRGHDTVIGKCAYSEWRMMHRCGAISYIHSRDRVEES